MAALASVDPTSIGRPSTTTSPPSRPSSPQIIEIVVVLPAPLGPSRPYVSPAATEKLTPSTAVRVPKRLRRSRQSSTGVGMAILECRGQAGPRREPSVTSSPATGAPCRASALTCREPLEASNVSARRLLSTVTRVDAVRAICWRGRSRRAGDDWPGQRTRSFDDGPNFLAQFVSRHRSVEHAGNENVANGPSEPCYIQVRGNRYR